MSSSRYRLTPAIDQAIVAYTRAGGYPHVAAEAAGVPRPVFEEWRRLGEQRRAQAAYRSFAERARQAAAQARLGAEVNIHNDKPLDWLRNGPGRETADAPGWTSPVRPRAGTRPDSALLDADFQAVVARLMESLADFPEARAAAARALDGDDGSLSRN